MKQLLIHSFAKNIGNTLKIRSRRQIINNEIIIDQRKSYFRMCKYNLLKFSNYIIEFCLI